MNANDEVLVDAEGRDRALRDDAQLTFLQLLPFIHGNSYVGVFHFAENVKAVNLQGTPATELRPGLMPWQNTLLDLESIRDRLDSVKRTVA